MGQTDFDQIGATGVNLGAAQIVESELEQLDGITPGAAAASKCVVLDANKAVSDITALAPTQVASADGAITIKHGTVVITKAGVAALTLADPTAATDDFKVLIILSVTAQAHTISNAAGSGFNAGGAGADVATLGGAKGDGLTVMAYQGDWFVLNSKNATLG
jgi:hypothetical protein